MPYFHDDYERMPPELMSGKADAETLRGIMADYLARDVPSRGKWEYLVQEHTHDKSDGDGLKAMIKKLIGEGLITNAFGHVVDEGVTYYVAVDNPATLRKILADSPVKGPDRRRVVEELSPPIVGLNILLQSTKQFQQQVRAKEVEDPFGIYSMDLSNYSVPGDINYGTRPHPVDPSKGLYLINEKIPSFGVRVDPLADLAMHNLSLQSVRHLLDMYGSGGCIMVHKPPYDIGNIRVINPASMSELEANIKSHPWFGTIGPSDRTVTALTALA